MRTGALTAGLVLVGVVLAGCGGQDDDQTTAGDAPGGAASASDPGEPSGSPALPRPQCDDVWVTGATLPGGYELCYDGQTRVPPGGVYCEVGEPLVTHDGRWWAVRGGEVQEATTDGRLVEDPGYRRDLRPCRG